MTACLHDDIAVEEWDFGRCSETGYHDAGIRFTCRECGEIWTGEEIAALAAESD